VLVPAHSVLALERAELEECTTAAEIEGQGVAWLGLRSGVHPYQPVGDRLVAQIEHPRER
jgi:hypothetical protein